MAIVFLALNGVGLGHLVRATIACRALEAAGERPVVFSQGIYPLDDSVRTPGTRVPSLWKATPDERRRVSLELAAAAGISLPAVLVEDTHPNPVQLPAEVRRVLLVRPASVEYLDLLHRDFDATYSAFILCDAPGSPTWPYTDAETARVLARPKWRVLGPIYRGASAAEIAAVRARYGLEDGRRLCVFTMGGGGQHPPYDDAERFAALTSRVAGELRARDADARLVFVKGPYFPDDVALDERLEVVESEPAMPALIAAAHGAVIRAGFNTIWECVAAGTPFLAYEGATHGEPTAERLGRLRALGLLAEDPGALWDDAGGRADYRRACARASAEWPGAPDGTALRALILGAPAGAGVMPVARPGGLSRRRADARSRLRGTPLVVRVDDVVSLEPALAWLLALLAARGLPASLEVVPYLTTGLDDDVLDAVDPTRAGLEVSQHGWAHLPREEEGPTAERDIVLGAERLRAAFPARFRGGYSPPGDVLPAWLPECWRAAGGAFMSLGSAPDAVAASPLAVLRAGLDPWSARRARGRGVGEVVRALEAQARADGHAGVILHSRRLRAAMERARLVALLDVLERRGFRGARLSEIAAGQSAAGAAPRSYLRRLADWVTGPA